MLASSSFAISRIGSCAFGDLTEGFQTTLPIEFGSKLMPLAKNGIRGDGPPSLVFGGFLSPQFTDFYPLREIYPQYMIDDRNEFQTQLTQNNWQQKATTHPCIEVFYNGTSTAHAFVISWGDGRGFVGVGPATPAVLSALEEAVKNISLDPGACSWN